MDAEEIRHALRRAFRLGQDYWYQADHEFISQQKKADATRAKFDQLVEDTCQAFERDKKEDLQKSVELTVKECARVVEDAVDHREPASTYVAKLKEHFQKHSPGKIE
jgi:hypothetical protein